MDTVKTATKKRDYLSLVSQSHTCYRSFLEGLNKMLFQQNPVQQDQSRSIEEKVEVVMKRTQLTLEQEVAHDCPRNVTGLTGRTLVKH